MTILRRFTDFVLQNRLQAIGVTFVLAFFPMLGSISILIAGLVTLRKGALEGALVLLAATLPYVLRYYSGYAGADNDGFEFFALMVVIVSNILVWLFAILLKRYNNWNVILEYSLLIGIVFIGMLHIVVVDLQSWWANELLQFFNKSNTLAGLSGQDLEKNRELQAKMLATLKGSVTGVLVATVSLYTILQLLIARWWQACIFNPGGLRQELHNIKLSHVVSIVFVICGVLSLLKNETAMDIMPLIYAIFSIAGLSLLHYYLSKTKSAWLWLSLVYILFILIFPASLIILSMIALLDSWVDIRKRWVKL